MTSHSSSRPRWLPERRFPAYAYLPGRQPHPVRDPGGHSYDPSGRGGRVEPNIVAAGASLGSEEFRFGLDLFNHGYYWEAHEAWEGLWQMSEKRDPLRMFFKGLILLAAAGVKIREGKRAAALRHAGRAASLLNRLPEMSDNPFERALGMSPSTLAEYVVAAAGNRAALEETPSGQPQPVFSFVLGPRTSA